MEIQLINEALLVEQHEKAKANERKRMNFDLRTTPEDTSQRMMNSLEVGTKVPIHRHLKSSETLICIEGCLDEIFYEEIPNMVEGGPVHNGEIASDESVFKEVARFRICPRNGTYGIQIPQGKWHTIEVYEPSTTIEAKDGAYGK